MSRDEEGVDRAVESFTAVAFSEKPKFEPIKYKAIPGKLRKTVEAALKEWNIDPDDDDLDRDVRRVRFGKKGILYVVSASGDPGPHFEAAIIVDKTGLVGKTIRTWD